MRLHPVILVIRQAKPYVTSCKNKACIPHRLVYHMTLRSDNYRNYSVISTPQCITHHIFTMMVHSYTKQWVGESRDTIVSLVFSVLILIPIDLCTMHGLLYGRLN